MYIMVRHLGMVHISGRIHSPYLSGCGMGSVLLNTGGAGSGSSYSSLEDYQHTTGNPIPAGVGSGINEKLAKLMVKPLSKKPNAIRF